MPLLNRKPYVIDTALPQGLKEDEEVFVIQLTQEVFRDYKAYLIKVETYQKPLWACKYSGKGGLTFQEALQEEQKALTALAKFPNELEEQVVRAIHHSMLGMDPLVGKIYDALRPAKPAEEGEKDPQAMAAVGKEEQQGEADAAAAAGSGAPEASPLAGKENEQQQQQGAAAGVGAEKAKKPKAPVARNVVRTFVLEHATQQGPEGGKTQVWVVKPELAEKYQLPSEIPAEIQAKLAASLKPPKKRPSDAGAAAPKADKKPRKEGAGAKKAAGSAPAAASRPTSTSPQPQPALATSMAVSGDPSRAEGMDDSEPRQPVKAKTLEEVEAQYKPGSVKHVMVQVFKVVQPEGLTLAGVVDKAKELGLAEYDEKQKGSIRHAFSADSNFVRLSQGVYSLHCLHPHLVVLQKPPVPKKRKITEHFFSPEEGEEGQQEGPAAAAAASKPLPKVESRAQLGGGTAAADKAQQQHEEEVDGVTKAERLAKQAKAAAEKHRTALGKAQKAFDEAKKAHAEVKKKMQLKSPSSSKGRESDVHIPGEQLAQFELSAEEREFKGDADDRKAMMEHRQFLQRRVKELEVQKKAFIQAECAKRETERAKREADLKNSNTEFKQAAESALRKCEHELAQARKAAESAEKALAEAERRLTQERKKVENAEAKAKEKEEKEKQRQAEKEERERRKAEALAAKRYPIDDLQLLEELAQAAAESGEPMPPADVHQPGWLGGEEQAQLSSGLCISDFLHQFGKTLGLKPLCFSDLERVLSAAAAGGRSGGRAGARAEEELGAGTLHAIYQRLLQVILDDLRASGEIGAMEKRWRSVLSEATWPEVLRRFVLTRAHSEEAYKRSDEHVALAAGMLGFDSADALTHDQHLHLLRFLCDEALDTEKMRAALQKRADGADDAKRDILKEMAEERKKLKAQQEQEKEERRRRKEEDKQKLEEEKAIAATAGADASANQEGAAAAEPAGPSKQASVDPAAAATPAGTPAEPSFNLPEELQEYKGDPDDKKGMIQFRQQQQAERRRLEKARNKWLAEQLRRQREIEARLKEQREAEKAKQKEREAAEEAIARAQEELEEALERYSTRRVPLGHDRHHRRYWWGLGVHRPAVYVEDEQGRWGSFTTVEEVEALIDSLDRRGVRELALAQALDKRYNTIVVAIRKAAQQEERERERAEKGAKGQKVKAPAPAQAVRRSARDAHQVEFFDPAKAATNPRPASAAAGGKAAAAAAAAAELAALFGPVELAAFEGALAHMAAVQKSVAATAGAATWAAWSEGLNAIAEGRLLGGGKASSASSLRTALQARLQELEAAVYSVSDKREEEEEEGGSSGGEREESACSEGHEGSAEPDEGGISRSQSFEVLEYVDSDGELSPTKVRDVTWLWRSAKERAAWHADLSQAMSTTRVAYCASVLHQQAEPLLQTLRRAGGSGAASRRSAKEPAAAGEGPAGKGRAVRRENAEAAGTAAEGNRSVAQTKARDARRQARGGSPPPSAAAAGGRGKASGAGERTGSEKRKGAAEAPVENARVTRSRKA